MLIFRRSKCIVTASGNFVANFVAEYLELVTVCTSCGRGLKFWIDNVTKSDNWKTKK